MIKTILVSFVLCLTTQMLLAQQPILLEPMKISEEYTGKIKQTIDNFKIVRLDSNVLRNISKNNKGNLDLHLIIGDDYDWKITLEENNIKGPNYSIEENNKSFDSQQQTVTTYKGYLNANSYNHVRLAISETMFEGYFSNEREMIFIRPLNSIIPNYPAKDYFIIFNAKDIKDNLNIKECGIEQIKKIYQLKSLTTARATTSCRVLEIATEADFEFFQANGSNVATANNSILATLNQVEGVYQATFNIRFLVAYQSVWSNTNDPYSVVGGTSVVDELANWWQANRTNVSRDIVFFFSAKTGHNVKGSARVWGGTVCSSQVNSYAFSATALTNNLVITTAHEIGHLFSATHPDLSSTACSPTRTIMCTDASNLGRVLQFATFSQDEINTWVNGHNACLTDVLNVNIGGTDPVCSTGQFTVVGLPPNSSIISWSSTNTSALTVTNNGVPSRQNNYVGQVDVTANGNYGNDGCTFTSTTPIWVGQPSSFTTNPSGVPAVQASLGSWVVIRVYSTPGASISSLNWWTNNSSALDLNIGSGNCSVECQQTGYNYVYVTSSNVCGTSFARQIPINVTSGGGGGGQMLNVMPNPSSSYIDIELPFNLEKGKGEKVEVTIFNDQSFPVYSKTYAQSSFTINTQTLPEGLYYLKVVYKENLYTQQILIKR